jgi:O-antigen ligase
MRLLTAGLMVLVVAAPMPFGAVGAGGRLFLESFALALTALWGVLAARGEIPLPPKAALFGMFGLLALAAIQIVPWGGGTISVAPDATASALRTGAALVGTLLVATSVVARGGGRYLATALLLSAAFQGLYGLIVLASGHPAIWGIPKADYLDSATGTFVNHNHFAALLAASLPVGLGLVVATAKRARALSAGASTLAAATGHDGTRALLQALLAAVGLAGLLLSFSRAGTALGLFAVVSCLVVGLRGRPVRGVALAFLLVGVAAIPLADIGAARLSARYAVAGEDLSAPGGRLDVWKATAMMIADRPAAGFGFGGYTWAFPAYRPGDVRLHYTHAHDDLLQLGAEGGIIAWALFGCILVPGLAASARVLKTAQDPIAVGAVFGLAALLLHGLIDFPFHIPAVALVGSVLAGLAFGATWTARS